MVIVKARIKMNIESLKNIGLEFLKKMKRNRLLQLIIDLKNIIEELIYENKSLRDTVLRQQDEINHLKGEKGSPQIKPNNNGENEDSSRSEKKPQKKKKRWKKSKKKQSVKISRTQRCRIDKNILPDDARYKGTRTVVIQDITVAIDNIAFEIERYYSPSLGKTYEAQLPDSYSYGAFGPGIHSLILVLHYQGRIPQKRLHTLLTDMGVLISEGEIWEIMKKCGEDFLPEMNEAKEAALSQQDFQQIDDTSARIAGKNGYSITCCNDFFTAYDTGFSKNRLSALSALAGGKQLRFIINDTSILYLKEKLSAKSSVIDVLKKMKSDRVYNTDAFDQEIINNPQLSKFGEYTIRYIKEGCAIAAYKAELLGPYTPKLVCDDAPQFKCLTQYLQLCWVHEERHYKKLTPYIEDHREILNEFMDSFWNYYDKLKAYKKKPSLKMKKKLYQEFDTLFSHDTPYAPLKKIMKDTQMKKDALLLVLEFPEVPLHNNSCELDVREKVIQRKIRNCHRALAGQCC
jgi:hypothetical protein